MNLKTLKNKLGIDPDIMSRFILYMQAGLQLNERSHVMFRIGEFSKLVRVSPRMLRHYEKCGLLYPAEINKFTGYRTYSAGQIPILTKIVTFRDMGFSIDEIGDILPHIDDVAYINNMLYAKMDNVQNVIEAENEKLLKLRQMSVSLRKEQTNMVYDVELRELPGVKVLSLRQRICAYDKEGELWHRLRKFMIQNGIACEDGGYSIYHDDEFKENDVDVEIAVPVLELRENQGDFIYKNLKSIPLAVTVQFSGPYEVGYPNAMEKLGSWIERNHYTFDGNIRGFAVVSPPEDQNPENFLTELQVAVVKK